MDVRVKQWMRSWTTGAATLGLMGSGMLAAQTSRPAPKPIDRSAIPTQPALLQPAPHAIQLATHESTPNSVQVAESEVEARLRELYERDGREMPNMTVPPASSAATSAPRMAPASQPRYSSAPPAASVPKSQNRVTGFFKKLLPGGTKQRLAQAAAQPPRQLHMSGPQSPAAQPMPASVQPQTFQQPQRIPPYQPVQEYQPVPQTQSNFNGQVAAEARPQPQPAARSVAVPTQPAPVIRSSAATRSSSPSAPSGNPVRTSPAPAQSTAFPDDEPVMLTAPRHEDGAAPRTGEPEISFETDEFDAEDVEITPRPVTTPQSAFDEEFPDPFAGAAEDGPSADEGQSPYTGQTLEPVEVPQSFPTPAIRPQSHVDEAAVDETTATKMRRIVQRADMKGLKGFCPVTLRDQRELADSRPEHVASYRGQKFYCASKVAQAKFEADPARYAPAAYGADVVVLTDDQDVAEGVLDYAAWYKSRLYLFSSQETHDTFVANPERYASPPGIE